MENENNSMVILVFMMPESFLVLDEDEEKRRGERSFKTRLSCQKTKTSAKDEMWEEETEEIQTQK